MPFPIIFLHYGDAHYLKYSLMQAKKFNKDAEVILIGDDSNNKYDFVYHLNIADNYKSAQEFAKVYTHRCSNSHGYELFCFQRWFILKDVFVKYGLDRCYHQDSDVMLYTKVSEEECGNADFAFCDGVNGGICIINSLSALENFRTFVMEHYTQRTLIEYLDNWHQIHLRKKQPGGVCDMTLVTEYCAKHPEKIYNLSEIHNDAVYDRNINLPFDYEAASGRKKIYLTSNGVFGRNLVLNKFIKFKALHFQGHTKHFMPYFAVNIPENCTNPLVFDYASCKWGAIRGY